jgi:hypothetical protein
MPRKEKAVMMVYDDPQREERVGRVLVPISKVREMQRKHKDLNMRVDTRKMPGPMKFAKGVADILPSGLSIAGDLAGGAVGGILAGGGSVPSGGATLFGVPAAIAGGRVAGGTLGSATGQALREGAYHLMGLGDAPGTVLGEAGMGAAGSATGVPVGAAAEKFAAPFVAKMALGFKNPAATPEVVQNILKNRYFVRSKEAIKAAGDALGKAIDERLAVLGEATRRGGIASYKAVSDEIEQLAEQLSKHGDTPGAEKMIKRLDKFNQVLVRKLSGWAKTKRLDPADLKDAQEMVTVFDAKLKSYYNKIANGKTVPFKELPPQMQFYKTAADNMRGQIQTVVDNIEKATGKVAGSMLPEGAKTYADVSKRVGIASGTTRALKIANAASRFPGGPQALAGAGLAGGGLTAALMGGGSIPATAASIAGLAAITPEVTTRVAPFLPGVARFGIPVGRAGAAELGFGEPSTYFGQADPNQPYMQLVEVADKK